MFARLDRLIAGEEILFPAAEIGLFRQQAGGPQLVEDLGIARMLIDEGLIERPELAIGGIMKNETLAAVEYGDRSRKLIERARMRLHLALEIGSHRLDLRHVDRHADRAHAHRHIDDVEQAPLAGGHRRRAAAPDRGVAASLSGGFARRPFEKLSSAQKSVGRVLGFDRTNIGGVDPDELAVGGTQPDGIGNGVEQSAQGVKLGDGAHKPLAQTHRFEAISGNIPDAHDRATADGAAVNLERAPAEALDRKAEAFAARPKPFDASLELLRRIRRQPGTKAEDAAGDRRVRDEAEIALDFGLAARAAPRDDDLRFGREKHLGAVELGPQIIELERECRLRLRPAAMFPQVEKGRDRREEHEPDDEREPDDDVLIFAEVLEHGQRIIHLAKSWRAGEAEDRRKSRLPGREHANADQRQSLPSPIPGNAVPRSFAHSDLSRAHDATAANRCHPARIAYLQHVRVKRRDLNSDRDRA